MMNETELILDVQTPTGTRHIALRAGELSFGRGAAANVQIDDPGLSRLHASIRREGDAWVLRDENSVNGTVCNGKPVNAAGVCLAHRDNIRFGAVATVKVTLRAVAGERAAPASVGAALPRAAVIATVVLLAIVLVGVIVWLMQSANARKRETTSMALNPVAPSATVAALPSIAPTNPTLAMLPPASASVLDAALPDATVGKLYQQMNEEERYDFLDRKARQITRLMGNREYIFEREVLGYIKEYADGYARRTGNRVQQGWGKDTRVMFDRAVTYAPDIIAAFRQERVPVVLGLYIPVIETEYSPCLTSPVGAVGLFQFMPDTAKGYGVDPARRCDEKVMAPAAARYMKDRIREFGTDAMSVALSIAGYNRSPASVRRDLQDVVDNKTNERSFWTLLARKQELDHFFQNENVKYVPKFFAAAIVGENPAVFGLSIRKLSTYDQPAR